MQVTDKTTYEEFCVVEPYLTEESERALKDAAEKHYGSVYSLEFGTFYDCVNGNTAAVLGDMTNPTVLQAYWLKRLAETANEFAAALKRLTVGQTSEEVQASSGLVKSTWDEGILVFLQEFFGLRSYKDAERITLGEILIAKKAAYNREKFRRQLNNIYRKKSGLKWT